jgi:hypothetical protein
MRLLLPLFLLACSGGGDADTDLPVDSSECDYPVAAEPMAHNEPLAAYSWAQALLADGRTLPLDLTQAYCNSDTSYDWSPHDYMLFVSVPAW